MNEVEKMYENAGIKPEYRYDCNVIDTYEPEEVFPIRSCSKGEIKDYCTSKQYYLYCKVFKVNKVYPLFTAEKQIELIKWLIQKNFYDERIIRSNYEKTCFYCSYLYDYCKSENFEKFEEALANVFNYFWQDLTEEERKQIKEILE